MKNYFIRITVNDPYPKRYDVTGKGTKAEVAIKRAVERWRREHWKGRPLSQITIYAELLKI